MASILTQMKEATPGGNGNSNGNTNGDSNDVATRNYIKWDAPNVESIPPNEAEDIQAVADMINKIQHAQFNCHRHMYGGTHARTQGLSLFSKPAKYPIAMRYSTEPGDPGLDDRIAQPRGLGMKVFNVEGEMFDEGKGFPTQDIEFNSTPALDLADAKTTKEIIDIRIKYGGNKEKMYKHLEARKDTDLQKARDQVRNTHLESTRQYSQTAYRYGDYVVKYCLVPSNETQKQLYEEQVKPDEHPNHILSDWLADFHANHDAEYLFQVQLLENLEDQPVEYAGKVWDDEKYPWQTVAKLVIPKQDSMIPARKDFWINNMRLDPWHGLKSFQPLGSSNRLRKVVYPASSALRRKVNGRKEIHCKSIDEIPDGGQLAC